MPCFEVDLERVLRRRRWRRPEHGVGKGGERLRRGPHGRDCVVEVREEALEIHDRRSAVDPVGGAVDVDLPGVAGRAGHADRRPARVIGHREADREVGRRIRDWADSRIGSRLSARKALAVGLLEGLHPRQGHDPRTLVLGVERLPALGCPVGTLIDYDDLRGGRDGDLHQRRQCKSRHAHRPGLSMTGHVHFSNIWAKFRQAQDDYSINPGGFATLVPHGRESHARPRRLELRHRPRATAAVKLGEGDDP